MTRDLVPLRTATRAWFRISLQTFGGPAGQIAVMQRELVDERKWIGQRRFLHALNYCMLLPGPEAQQLAIYAGWLLNGLRGGLIAGTFFILPGVVAMLALSAVYVGFGDVKWVSAVFAGIAPAVIAIVVHALLRVAKRALTGPALVAIAVAAFVALQLFAVPFPAVVLGAGVLGWLLGRLRPGLVAQADDDVEDALVDDAAASRQVSRRRLLAILVTGLVLWFTPVITFAVLVTSTDVFTDMGLFFSGSALVTFGGAYAVLAYVAQQAVGVYGWLAPGEMLRGLALAETTPGPLIMVLQFVGFVAAYRHPGDLNPWVAAILGGLLVTWVTFVPSFMLVLLGAPYVERLRGNRQLAAALTGVTASVVGVIASLALYFGLHTIFSDTFDGPFALELPVLGSWQPVAVGITAVALVLMFDRGWGVLRTIGVCAALGAAIYGLGAVTLPSP